MIDCTARANSIILREMMRGQWSESGRTRLLDLLIAGFAVAHHGQLSAQYRLVHVRTTSLLYSEYVSMCVCVCIHSRTCMRKYMC